jgi:hypothetical protein
VKGAAVTRKQVIGAEMTAAVKVAAPGLSNALDMRVTTTMVPVSNALDAAASDTAGRDRRRWAEERGAPPGRTSHRNARGPVEPALSILGGAKMSTQ